MAHTPQRLLGERIRTFFRVLPRALAGEPEGIHQLRVAGRRLRVVVPLVARKPAGRRTRRARRTLKRLIRDAAPARDLDVCLALFDAQVEAGALPGPAARALRRGLAAARTRSRRRMRDAMLDEEVPRLRRDLRALVQTAEEDVPIVLARVRHARDEDGARLLAGLESLGDAFDGEALHALRRQVRRLRYVAEAAGELGGAGGKAPKRLKAVQEQLGAIHDAWLLAGRLGRRAARAERRGTAWAPEARRLEAACLDLSRRRHADYLAADPVGTVKQALVLLAPAP